MRKSSFLKCVIRRANDAQPLGPVTNLGGACRALESAVFASERVGIDPVGIYPVVEVTLIRDGV